MSYPGAFPSVDLETADHDLLDEAEFQRIREWNRIRIGGGTYRLGDYSVHVLINNFCWVINYCLRLRQRIRESKDVHHLRELEGENARLQIKLRRAEDRTSMRRGKM